MFKEFDNTSWGKKVINDISSRFGGINLGGVGFTFHEKPEVARNIKYNFKEFLVEICDELDKTENGFFIIIDDVNELSETPDFANWYKWLFETLYFYNMYIPLVFTLVAYPDNFDQLCEYNPSFSRMFNLIQIDKLDNEDINF